jgi:phosphatidylcholine synthase
MPERHPGAPSAAGPSVPPQIDISRAARLLAWGVHGFTATGAVFGFLALAATAAGEWQAALLWMAATLAVDGFDGMLARWAAVQRVLPGFDGALLDNMVDYFTYVVVPAFFLYRAPVLPAGWNLVAAAAILLSSAFQFCRIDAKTEDHFFTGFPSYWNIVAFYLLFLEFPPAAAMAAVGGLCILVFVPFRYAYPSRTPTLRSLTLALTVLWGLLCLAALLSYPDGHRPLAWLSLLYLPYYLGVSVLAGRRLPAGAGAPP